MLPAVADVPSAPVAIDVSALAMPARVAVEEPTAKLDERGDDIEALLISSDLDGVKAAAAEDELILDEEIGIGAIGWSMASRLVQAGFAVTSAPAQHRRHSKRLNIDSFDLPS